MGLSLCSFDAPCDCEQDEMQQVLAAVANGAGLVALSMTGDAPG